MEPKDADATLKGFLLNNRRAQDSWDCIWRPVAPGVFGSLSRFRRSRPTLGAVQMGSCVEK